MSGEKYCLQCGAPLVLKSVAADPVYPYGPHVTACSACGSRSYDVSGNKIKELTGQRDELLAALKGLADGKCVDLGDLVYDIREREGEGWEGLKVVAWGKAVETARAIITRIEAAR